MSEEHKNGARGDDENDSNSMQCNEKRLRNSKAPNKILAELKEHCKSF